MSSNSLAVTSSRHWGPRYQYESSHDDGQDYYVIPVPLHYRPEEGGGMYAPWRLFEERIRTGPYGLSSFPSQPYSPIRILILDPGTQERVNPRLRQFIRDSPPRIRNDWQLGFANQEPGNPSLTNEEFKKTMKKLKKQIYRPTYPKRRSGLRGIFSTLHNTSIADNKLEDDDQKNGGSCCTICLEDFVPNEPVLVTPCNHKFHNDCLVPWVKSHGKCPVCRYVLCERSEGATSLNNHDYNSGRMVSEDGSDLDLVSLIRAMEEALNWVNVSH